MSDGSDGIIFIFFHYHLFKPPLVEVKQEPSDSLHTALDSVATSSTRETNETIDVKPDAVLWCICKSSESNELMIECEECHNWFHARCLKMTKRDMNAIDNYYCSPCIEKNTELKIIYKTDKKPEDAYRCGGACIGCFKAENCTLCDEDKRKQCPHHQCVQAVSVKKEAEEKQPKAKVVADRRKRGRKKKPVSDDSDDDEDFYIEVKPKVDFKEVRNKALEEAHLAAKHRRPTKRTPKPPREASPVQCLGPECILAARPDSKYCSEACGLKRAESRLELLPERARSFWSTPPLNYLRAIEQGKKVEIQIDECVRSSEKLIERMARVQKWVEVVKNIEPVSSDEEDEGDTELDKNSDQVVTYHCPVCALEYTLKAFPKHVERCFVRQEKQSEIGSSIEMKDRNPANLFCDAYNKSSDTYCKRLRVICAEHYKGELENEMKICGYPLAWTDLSSASTTFSGAFAIFDEIEKTMAKGFCQRPRRECGTHHRWLQNTLGILECERFNVLTHLDELCDRKRALMGVLNTTGDLITLLGGSTIEHDPAKPKTEVVSNGHA